MTKPRRLPYEYLKQKEWHRQANPKAWEEDKYHWELPTISEQEARAEAAMLDRFQKMFFRAQRALRDWRRYSPPVTINNPNQVNIGEQVNVATGGGQQVNLKK